MSSPLPKLPAVDLSNRFHSMLWDIARFLFYCWTPGFGRGLSW